MAHGDLPTTTARCGIVIDGNDDFPEHKGSFSGLMLSMTNNGELALTMRQRYCDRTRVVAVSSATAPRLVQSDRWQHVAVVRDDSKKSVRYGNQVFPFSSLFPRHFIPLRRSLYSIVGWLVRIA